MSHASRSDRAFGHSSAPRLACTYRVSRRALGRACDPSPRASYFPILVALGVVVCNRVAGFVAAAVVAAALCTNPSLGVPLLPPYPLWSPSFCCSTICRNRSRQRQAHRLLSTTTSTCRRTLTSSFFFCLLLLFVCTPERLYFSRIQMNDLNPKGANKMLIFFFSGDHTSTPNPCPLHA